MSGALATMRQRLGYQGLLLGAVAFLASGALLLANQFTAPSIAQRNAEDLSASLTQVLPGVRYDNALAADAVAVAGADGASTTVYRARLNGVVQAVAFETVGYGYSGAIRVVMGVDTQGRILSARVLSHRETPGLGDKIEIAKSPWIESFNGLSQNEPPPEQWKVKKDGGQFDQFTGATITPRAVVKAVKDGLDLFAAHRGEILAETSAGAQP